MIFHSYVSLPEGKFHSEAVSVLPLKFWYSLVFTTFFDTYANPVLPLFPCRWKQFNSTALDRMRLGWVPRVWGDMGLLQLEDRVVSPFYMIKTSEKGSSILKFTWSPIISKTLYKHIKVLIWTRNYLKSNWQGSRNSFTFSDNDFTNSDEKRSFYPSLQYWAYVWTPLLCTHLFEIKVVKCSYYSLDVELLLDTPRLNHLTSGSFWILTWQQVNCILKSVGIGVLCLTKKLTWAAENGHEGLFKKPPCLAMYISVKNSQL